MSARKIKVVVNILIVLVAAEGFAQKESGWIEPSLLGEILERQQNDNSEFGGFMLQSESIKHRTDVDRLSDSEQFLVDFLKSRNHPAAMFVDIGSGLGNPDPHLRGATVKSILNNHRFKNLKVIATDIPGEILDNPGLDVEEIPADFLTPFKKIADKRGITATLWIGRSANSVDVLASPDQTRQHLQYLLNQAGPEREMIYLFNIHILRKAPGTMKWELFGRLGPAGYSHRTKSWKDQKGANYRPYALINSENLVK